MTAAPGSASSIATRSVLEVPALAEAYRSGTLTPADVIRECARRIAERGDDGVWIALDLEGALEAATALAPSPTRHGRSGGSPSR